MESTHIKTYKDKFERILAEGREICAPYAARSPELKAAVEAAGITEDELAKLLKYLRETPPQGV